VLRCWSASVLFNGIHFLLLDAAGAATIALITALRFFVASLSTRRAWLWLFLAVAAGGFALTNNRPEGWLALAATVLGTWGSFQADQWRLRGALIACASLWAVHNYLIGSPVSTLMELSFLTSNIVGWIRLRARTTSA
jgi:hypothetical protein